MGLSFMTGREFMKALAEAGIIGEGTQRVVIEASMDKLLTVHVQMVGDSRLLAVMPTSANQVRIVREAKS